tara:strand:+ start:1041 stop:1892 length:852 start_codon:yes stop_codon:yes gene_type:complete
MNSLPRRQFIKTSLAASAAVTATLGSKLSAATETGKQEFYELRCYHLKADSRLKTNGKADLLDTYLEKAYLPALERRGIHGTGVFSELVVDKKAMTSEPMVDSPVWTLTRYASLNDYVGVSAEINADPMVRKTGAEYLDVPKKTPAFERIDSWLLRAFASMPMMEQPEFSRRRVPSRVFEMRDYESHSEAKALVKMAMFNEGETQLMRDLGMNPMFFGQALAGPNLPHLRYITCGPDLETHLKTWQTFGPSEGWQKMKSNPKYADSTSRNTARFLTPKAYSEI